MQTLFHLHHKKIDSRGFTLIELLIVVALIAMLTALAISTYSGIQAKGRDTKRRADVDEIRKSLELYYIGGSTTPYPAPVGNMFSDGVVPKDPKNATSYTYYFNGGAMPSTGTFATYVVCAKLENNGGNSQDPNGTPPSGPSSVLGYYCRKNVQ